MSIRLLVSALAAVSLFLVATSTWATGWHKPPVVKPPIVKPPVVKPTIVTPPVVVKPPVVAPPAAPPPVVTPTPPVVATPPATPAAPATQPAPVQQAGAGKGSSWFASGGAALIGTGIFMWAVVCSKEKERGEDTWFTRYLCLDVKIKERPTPEHMMATFATQ